MRFFSLICLSFWGYAYLWANPTFSDYHKKGSDYLKILDRLFNRYSFPKEEEESYEKIREEFRLSVNRYLVSQNKERNVIFRQVQKTYDKILEKGKLICQHLEEFSNYLLNDFSERLKNSKEENIPQEKYANQLSVAKRELSRAKEYYQKGQVVQAAHLYDRGIELLLRRYRELKWPLPEKYFPQVNLEK